MIVIAPLGTGPFWTIRSSAYSPALHKEAKATPGCRWDPMGRWWLGYPDAIKACMDRLHARGIRFSGRAPDYFKRETPSLKSGWADGLRKYQIAGVRFLLAQAEEGALLADDVGLGKSLTAIRTAKELRTPTIIVCPSFVRMVWQRELTKWRPKANLIELWGEKNVCPKCKGTGEPKKERPEVCKSCFPHPTHATPCPYCNCEDRWVCSACAGSGKRIDFKKPKKRNVYLVHYDIMHGWVGPLLENVIAKSEATTVIFDEAHYLMSDKSRRSAACRDLARSCTYRIGLTATPMTSRPRDLWNVVDTLCEGRFGRPFDFYLRHANAHKETITTREGDRVVWNTNGASNLDELHDRMIYFMLRRTKTQVKLELPPRTRQIVEVDVPRKFCKLPSASGFDFARGGGDLLKTDRAMREALSLAADGKLPKALEMIASHVEAGSKVIVFTHRVAIAENLAAALVDLGVQAEAITGDVSHKKRLAIVDEKPSVICCTLDSTSVGIDLSYADVVVFVELDWVPSKILQGEGRVHRFGAEKPVLVQYVIAVGTADEIIRDAVIGKLESFEKAVGKLDDGLKQSLGGGEEGEAEHLRKLFQKVLEMESSR